MFTGSQSDALFLTPTYDIVERVLIYRPVNPLRGGLVYTVEVIAPSDADPDGLRAFDGAPLVEGDVPLRFGFRTRRESPAEGPPTPLVPTCTDMVERTFNPCATAGCHAAASSTPSSCGPNAVDVGGECVGVPAMGMRLDSVEGLVDTVIGKVARQTETGPRVNQPLAQPDRFGTQMARVDPGNPATSYLMYKLLRNADNLVPRSGDVCESVHSVPVAAPGGAPVCSPAPGENERLREWFVLLEPMPTQGVRFGSREDLRDVERWISALSGPDPRARCTAP